MKSIVWLSSYPKSGNTWLWAFLTNYIMNSETPVPINQMHRIGMGDSNADMYRKVTKGFFDVTDPRQATRMRPHVLQAIVNNRADINFVKTHNDNGKAFGAVLIPPELTRSAIYIMRNPLDMVISFANHFGRTIDEVIDGIADKHNAVIGSANTTYQSLNTWSNHVVGWNKARKFPVLSLRYEDMLDNPHEAFERVIKHIGFPLSQEQLERAVRFSDFKVLQEQEAESGFSENSSNQERFFRSGKSEQWRSELTDEQVDKVLRDQGRVMKKYGYEV